jgi:hypothetical protein
MSALDGALAVVALVLTATALSAPQPVVYRIDHRLLGDR